MNEEKEIKYCIHCGYINKNTDTICTHCNKTIDPKENQFIDYLKKKTDDKFKDKIDGTIYDIIKNYLLSHLYGFFLTLTIISMIFVSNLGKTTITYVSDNNYQLNEDMLESEFINSTMEYVEYSTWNPDYSTGGHEIYLQHQLPDKYNYNTTHELTYDRGPSRTSTKFSYTDATINPTYPKSELGIQLMKDGYIIGEITLLETYEKYTNVIGQANYLITAVYIEDTWYIAEDIQTSNLDYNKEMTEETKNNISNLINKYFSYFALSSIDDRDILTDFYNLHIPSNYGYTAGANLYYGRQKDIANSNSITFDITYNSYSPNRPICYEFLQDNVEFAEVNVLENYYLDGTLIDKANFYVIVANLDNTWYIVQCESIEE